MSSTWDRFIVLKVQSKVSLAVVIVAVPKHQARTLPEVPFYRK